MLLDLFLLELLSHYSGNPYYVTGNAIAHATRLTGQLTDEQKKRLSISHGIIKTFARNDNLDKPADYSEFFKIWRTPRTSRSELIVPELRYYHPDRGAPFILMSPTRYEGKKDPDKEQNRRSTLISFYVIGLEDTDPNIFDGIAIGGRRNMGMGKTRLHLHISTDTSQWTGFPENDKLGVELITPLCLRSTFPGCDETNFPNFLEPHASGRFRTREEGITIHQKKVDLHLLDSGQAFAIKECLPRTELQKTINNGIERIGTHSKYGYGEYKVFAFAQQ